MREESNQVPATSTDQDAARAKTVAAPATPVRVDVSPARVDARGVGSEQRQGPKSGEFGDIGRIVHRSLRGRYLATCFVALLGAVGGVVGGTKFGRPIYKSEALLRIAYSMPAVLQETDQNRPMQMFDTFMLSQKLLITSRRVIDTAVQDPIWKATKRELPDAADRYFAQHLDVTIKPRSEFVSIAVQDENPGTAQAAATSVTNAYQDLYNNQEKRLDQERTGALEDRQNFVQTRIKQLAEQMDAESKPFGGTQNLEALCAAASARVDKIASALADVRVARATGGAPTTAPATRAATSQPATQPVLAVTPPQVPRTPEQVASGDLMMRHLLDEQNRIRAELEQLKIDAGPAHRLVKVKQVELDQAKANVEKYMQTVPDVPVGAVGSTNRPGTTADGKSPEEIRAEELRLKQVYDEAFQEMVRLGKTRMELQAQEQEIKALREEQDQLAKRMTILRTESSLGGRLSVVSSPEIPLSSDRDPRPKWAGMAGAAGFCLPIALSIAVGLMRRRYDFSDETEWDIGVSAPLLGVLPDLTRSDAPEHRAAAARCIHQIRVLLRAWSGRRRSSVYLVTSTTAKEGKTSLTMSLGLSFAASGARTLVMDCDLVGRHFTDALGAGKLSGLCEALEKGTMNRIVRRGPAGLCVLTAGANNANDHYALPPQKIAVLLGEARRHFDVVLIDSGPILGSVEAAVIAPEVDGAILTIARGQNKWLARTAVERLRTLSVRIAGFVYNRAKPLDFHNSPFGSSTYSRPIETDGVSAAADSAPSSLVPQPNSKLKNFGPLVEAVVAGLPTHSWN